MNSKIGRSQNYLHSFFYLCEENGILEDVLYQLNSVQKIQEKEIANFMRYPVISKVEKKKTIESLKDLDFCQPIINLFKLLIDYNDFSLISQIISGYRQMYQDYYDVQIVTVTVAKRPSEKYFKHLVSLLEKKLNKSIVIKIIDDPTIIAGVKIEYDGKVLDHTTKNHLDKLIHQI